MIGLLNAAQNYTPTKGANFETYAGIRIRGAMLDEARKSNWTPRSTFRNAKQVSHAIRSIENRTGRDARGQEIAELLGVSHRGIPPDGRERGVEPHLELRAARGRSRAGVDVAGCARGRPRDDARGRPVPRGVGAAIAALPERERLVLSLYYDDELNLREIGEVLEVSESRVCQIHGQAVLRIRARLDEWFERMSVDKRAAAARAQLIIARRATMADSNALLRPCRRCRPPIGRNIGSSRRKRPPLEPPARAIRAGNDETHPCTAEQPTRTHRRVR